MAIVFYANSCLINHLALTGVLTVLLCCSAAVLLWSRWGSQRGGRRPCRQSRRPPSWQTWSSARAMMADQPLRRCAACTPLRLRGNRNASQTVRSRPSRDRPQPLHTRPSPLVRTSRCPVNATEDEPSRSSSASAESSHLTSANTISISATTMTLSSPSCTRISIGSNPGRSESGRSEMRSCTQPPSSAGTFSLA